MSRLTKRMTLGIGALIIMGALFLLYDYLDNQKKAEQSEAFIEESNQVMEEYEVTSLGIDVHHKTINVRGAIANEEHNRLNHSLGLIAHHHGMGDYRVVITPESE